MEKQSNKLKPGAIVMLGMWVMWLFLDAVSMIYAGSGLGVNLSLLLSYLVPLSITVLLLIASCKKAKIVTIIGASLGILWYLIRLFGNHISGLPYYATILQDFFLLTYMIFMLVLAITDNKILALRKLLCVLPALAFICSCIYYGWWLKYYGMFYWDIILFSPINYNRTSLPLIGMAGDMLQLLALTWAAGAVAGYGQRTDAGSGRGLRIVGLVLMGVANMMSIVIALLSKAIYNRVLYFRGDTIMSVFWVMDFMILVTGAILLCLGMMMVHKAASAESAQTVPVHQPVYQPPVQQPVYQQPIYQQPVYQQPVQQPVYQQPIYQQPVYQPPVQQPAQPAPQQKDVFEQLTQLKQMLDMELISQEEYDAKKKQILDL